LQQWNCRRLQRHQFCCLCSFLLLPFIFILFLVLIFRSFPYVCYSLTSLLFLIFPLPLFPSLLTFLFLLPSHLSFSITFSFVLFLLHLLLLCFHSPPTGPISSSLPSVFSFSSLRSSYRFLFPTLL
jgi:hypothetical protein